MTTPAQLSQALNRNAEQVCKHLLPNGKRIGHEWCAGDAYGGEGRSLKIVLDGDKAGVGSDFATGETFGDLLDLWCTTQSVGLSEAMAQACSYLGIVNDGQDSRPKKEYKRPPKPKSVQRLNKEGKVYQYLKSRGFTDQCLEDFRISEEQGQWIVFPYLREGQFINAKYLHIERTAEGKKQCRQEKDAEPCLFGWDALELRYPTTRFVVLTEGEGDTLTYHQCGLPALSIPNGGGGGKKQDWIDQDYDRLSRFDTIYLSMDNDGPGKEAEKEIITRLGSERIRVIQLPYKDANECFAKGIKTFHRYLL
ncbi:MAG: toprim domain-containing protein, partial [Streptococcus sp.]|nr:toprim domain-containing protein [Streptococcus sp.]